MKKLLLISALFLLNTFLGCNSMYLPIDYGTIKGWGYKEMPPTQVTTSGFTFHTIKISSNESYSVGGYIADPDATFYYNALYQDLGWNRDTDGNWESYDAPRLKRGHLYFDLKRGVAIYFYPDKTFNAFKVTRNTSTEED